MRMNPDIEKKLDELYAQQALLTELKLSTPISDWNKQKEYAIELEQIEYLLEETEARYYRYI
jgi:hypothetical protein